MSGPIGILDQLAPQQQDELFEMLWTLSTREVLAKISAPPPEGWGISTHATSLRRFYQRKQLALLREELDENAALQPSSTDIATLKKESLSSMLVSILHSARSPRGEHREAGKALQLLLQLEKMECTRERLKLDRERLDFEQKKSHAHHVLQSVRVSDALDRETMDQIIENFQTVIDKGFLLQSYWNPDPAIRELSKISKKPF